MVFMLNCFGLVLLLLEANKAINEDFKQEPFQSFNISHDLWLAIYLLSQIRKAMNLIIFLTCLDITGNFTNPSDSAKRWKHT